MSDGQPSRGHLSIGEVLSLVQDEFPDVSISKIRFLESQGLMDPERTPSGYRKFYEDDIARLRWILVQQRDHFLPLKVIKDRLDAGDVDYDDPSSAAPAGADDPDDPGSEPVANRGEGADQGEGAEGAPPRADVAGAGEASPEAATPEPVPPVRSTPPVPSLFRRGAEASPLDRGPTEGVVALTKQELADRAGVGTDDIDSLEQFGMLRGRQQGATRYYGDEALVVAKAAAGFLRHGVEARHLRMYKVAAEREAGFFGQLVMPLMKARRPDAHERASSTLDELAADGRRLHDAMLRQALDEVL